VAAEHVILFKDYLFYYDDNEYLKRPYKPDEVPPRMAILTDFYTNQYKVGSTTSLHCYILSLGNQT
jgi:hypothetical protein